MVSGVLLTGLQKQTERCAFALERVWIMNLPAGGMSQHGGHFGSTHTHGFVSCFLQVISFTNQH
jgi:hypothetical protein